MKKKFRRIAGIILGILILTGALSIYFIWQSHDGKAPAMDPAKRELWKSQAYNYILETDYEHLTLFNYTTDSVLPFAYGHIERDGTVWIDKIRGNALFNMLMWKPMPIGRFQNGTLSDEIGYRKQFDRIDQMPQVGISRFSEDPIQNFETFWQIFDENYALFGVHSAEWKKLYDDYRPKVKSDTSAGELKQVFKEIIQKLDDGHTQVIAGMQGIASQAKEDPRTAFYMNNGKKMKEIIQKTYFPDGLNSQLDGAIQYGQIQEGIGYIAVDSFNHFDMLQVNPAIDQVVHRLSDVDQIIVDLRFNGGGSDAFGLDLVSRFAASQTLAYTKTARNHKGYDSFLPPTPIYIEPNENRINAAEIIVLTSRLSTSAAETTRMAFGELNNVTVIGETTNGVFSDMMFNILPNQWIVTLSGEKYTDARGNIYEGAGMPPDEEVIYTEEDLDSERDPVMAKALELLK
ncbi:hypothetical protein DNH61_11885 [Paenibacillus sambharensis]|uniref:Tail specific protease domain-containing protein n=1 Tax=Paenibacillus sambharensis TaxID=1803190 RepID=A0A2W1L8L4_9BACL|nr:S41 family peptidase [Paenibacillus sambharensis]PZD95253.1 hypothetical protein DNH61_11885 [Paenibacillus sambharensis]